MNLPGINSNIYNERHKNMVVMVTHVTTVVNVIHVFRLTELKFHNVPQEELGVKLIKFVVSRATWWRKRRRW